MKFIGIIPARYASTRFPAKPLAILGGKTVIQRVYEQVAGILDDAYVATDAVMKLRLKLVVILMLWLIYKGTNLLSSHHNCRQ